MVKRSKASVVLSVLASIITFATYFLLVTLRDSAEVQDTLSDLWSQSHAMERIVENYINNICTTFLILAIATLVLGILASYFKIANVLLNILAWFYLFYGIIVLCLLQFLFCRSAASRNRKYFKKKALMNSGSLAESKINSCDEVAEVVSDVADENTEGEQDGVTAETAKEAVKSKNKRNVFNNNWGVILKNADAENSKVVKKIRKLTGFNKKEVVAFLENLPEFVMLNVSKKEAKKAYKKLTKLGCEVEII